MPPHLTDTPTLRQQLLRSLAKEGRHMRLVASREESASDWLLRAGPLAKRLNEESRHDDGAAA